MAAQGVPVLGVGTIGADPDRVENEYQRRLREELAARQRESETQQFEAQRQRILGAMQPSTIATEAAREQARQAGAATTGAARSQMGTAGTQTAALGALGAGQAQQAGMVEARQVQAQEEQRNALAQAQLAEMLRQQEMARLALERGDIAQALAGQRALAIPGEQQAAEAAAREAARARQMQGAALGALGTLVPTGMDLFGQYAARRQRDYEAEQNPLGF